MNRIQFLFGIAALFFATNCWSEEWTYTVRPGDELWNLASKYCGSAKYTSRLAAHNQLSDAKLIRPGSRIKFPIAWLVKQPTHAEVISVFGSAQLLAPDPQRITAGMRVAMGDSIETADGSVVVAFADESTLVIAENSRVLFNVLTAYGDTGMVDTNLRFYRGRGTSTINRREGRSKFRISTPSGTAAVRGTEFRVGVAPDVSITETLSGEVGFESKVTTHIPAGFGIAASEQGIVKEQLLPPPAWDTRSGPMPTNSRVQWAELPGAKKYRLIAFQASDLQTPVAQSVTEDRHFPLQELPVGQYQLAVRGISAAQIEGYSSTINVSVQSPPPSITKAAQFTFGDARIAWQPSAGGPPYHVQVSTNAAFTTPREFSTSEHSLSLTDLAGGDYLWRVRDSQSVFGETGNLTIRPAEVTGLQVEHADQQVSLQWLAVPGADSYRVEIHHAASDAAPVHDFTVHKPSAEASIEAFGAYRVRVTAIANGLAGTPASRGFEVRARPYWLLSLLLLPLLAL